MWSTLCAGALGLAFCSGLATSAEATTFIYEADRPSQYGSGAPGRIDNLRFTYSDTTEIFTMSATFETRSRARATEGFWLGLNDGPMPTKAGELAVLFVNESSNNPGTLEASLYSHDLTAHSYRGELLASREQVEAATNFSSITVTDREVNFSLSLNTGMLAQGFEGDVLSFNESIGIWFPWFTGLEPTYDQNGRLVKWLGSNAIHSQVDVANLSARSEMDPPAGVPEPASLALLVGALGFGSYQRQKKLMQ